MHASIDSDNARLNRRSLLKGASAAGFTVLTGTTVALAQDIDVEQPGATPGVALPPDPLPVGPTIASKAAELDFDIERIVRFVAEDVRYEPYAGSLRGATGTLWSLGGNSADKALLLAALLDEALVTYRFATGRLSAEQIEALASAAVTTPQMVLDHAARVSIAATGPRNFGSLVASPEPVETVALTPDEEAEIETMQAAGDQVLAGAQSLAATQVALIGEALRKGGVTLPEPAAFALPDLEVERHVWIQVADGPAWIDYDPTGIPGAPPTATETFGTLPEDLHHAIDIRLFAEEFLGGTMQRRELVRLYGPVSALVNLPVAIMVQPPAEFEAVGLTLNQLFSGDLSLVPYIHAGDTTVVANPPIVFGSNEPGVLDALSPGEGGLGEGETLAVWLDIQQTSPGEDPVHIERALMDRIGPGRRLQPIDLADPATRDAIQPVRLVEFYEGVQTIEQLAAVHLLNTEPARLDFTYALTDVESIGIYGAASFNVPGITALRDTLRLTAEAPAGFQSVIARPQLTLTSMSLIDTAEDGNQRDVELAIDLLYRHPGTIPVNGSSEATSHPAVLAGVLDQVSEHQLVLGMEEQDPGVARGGLTVAGIFELAVEQDVPVRTVKTVGDLGALELDAVSRSLLERGLADGFVAVVPERPVTFNEEQRAGWWFVHPQTGRTWDQLDTGKGGASVTISSSRLGLTGRRFSVTVEEAKQNEMSTQASKPFRRTLCGRIVSAITGAVMAIGAAAALANGDAVGAAKALGPAAKVEEARRRTKEVADQVKRRSGQSCG